MPRKIRLVTESHTERLHEKMALTRAHITKAPTKVDGWMSTIPHAQEVFPQINEDFKKNYRRRWHLNTCLLVSALHFNNTWSEFLSSSLPIAKQSQLTAQTVIRHVRHTLHSPVTIFGKEQTVTHQLENGINLIYALDTCPTFHFLTIIIIFAWWT